MSPPCLLTEQLVVNGRDTFLNKIPFNSNLSPSNPENRARSCYIWRAERSKKKTRRIVLHRNNLSVPQDEWDAHAAPAPERQHDVNVVNAHLIKDSVGSNDSLAADTMKSCHRLSAIRSTSRPVNGARRCGRWCRGRSELLLIHFMVIFSFPLWLHRWRPRPDDIFSHDPFWNNFVFLMTFWYDPGTISKD